MPREAQHGALQSDEIHLERDANFHKFHAALTAAQIKEPVSTPPPPDIEPTKKERLYSWCSREVAFTASCRENNDRANSAQEKAAPK
jgi:hypothetical protein